ncbi:MAG TPA: GTPase domain-containing protein [Actinomycetales bacterium]|nr:GTPase domain-containing protein [Actinomycetales bacterium]
MSTASWSAADGSGDPLLPAVLSLRSALSALTLPLQLDGVEEARRDRQSLIDQLDDYVLPRLRSLDAPLLAVVGGSTGAGKSTLVNSLLGHVVSRSGVLRPTTRSPVLVHHEDDARWFTDQRILPGLARLHGEAPAGGTPSAGGSGRSVHPAGGTTSGTASEVSLTKPGETADGRISSMRLVSSDALPPGLALLDAPDIDSVVSANRALAQQLLAAADLWLFVTTAARYADAVPWDLLAGAAARGASVAVVLDRVPPEALDEVRTHLASMLRDRGLRSSPLFVIPETAPDGEGLLAPEVVRPVRSWLVALARDAAARQVVVRRTLNGALASLRPRTVALVEAAEAQDDALAGLRLAVETAYADAVRRVDDGLTDGTLLRGEVLARWQELVGTGELLRTLEQHVGRLRDRVVAALRGRPAPEAELGEALQSGAEALLTAQARAASDDAARRWRSVEGGLALAAAHPALAAPAAGVEDRVARTVRDWQGYVLELVRSEGGDRRTTAKVLSYGVNGLGVLLMLVVFSQTGGLTGAEAGIAGGTVVVAQRVLEAVFGDQAVRSLATKARRDLIRRAGDVLAGDRERFDVVLDALAGDEVDRRPTGSRAAAVRDAVRALENAR